MARSFGARVVAISRSESKRALAVRFGADHALAPEEAFRVRKETDGLGADVVVECTGNPEGFAHAVDLVRPRGVVALKSTCGRDAVGLDTRAADIDAVAADLAECPSDQAAFAKVTVERVG